MFKSVVACDRKGGIARNGQIPWKHKTDLQWFKQLTTGHVVIMGRATYQSIGKALPGRINVVCTQLTFPDCVVFQDMWECVRWCLAIKDKQLFVIGGSQCYQWFVDNQLIGEQYITEIDYDYSCDMFYPKTHAQDKTILSTYTEISRDFPYEVRCNITHSVIMNTNEQRMLQVMHAAMRTPLRNVRNACATHSVFGEHFEFDLTNNTFPLMTTRKMFLRGIFEELMLYLRGNTDSKLLEAKGINVWAANTTREFLDSRGLQDLPVGDMGHSYGHSFRHFGAPYINCNTNYTGVGYDQLAAVINGIKNDPTSRRLIISLWEPNNMHRAALPPCLYCYQFYVEPAQTDGQPVRADGQPVRADGQPVRADGQPVRADQKSARLSCAMTQRSSDFAVAGGWNVATGALLTILIAQITGLSPYKLIWNIGDLHIYDNCMVGCIEQIKRTPYVYPKLFLKNSPIRIEDFQYENLILLNYKSQSAISYPMNA
jgi:thymidylate synthase/dihydrofolate reductase